MRGTTLNQGFSRPGEDPPEPQLSLQQRASLLAFMGDASGIRRARSLRGLLRLVPPYKDALLGNEGVMLRAPVVTVACEGWSTSDLDYGLD